MKLILTDAERERAAECVHESGAVACVLAPSLRAPGRSILRAVRGGRPTGCAVRGPDSPMFTPCSRAVDQIGHDLAQPLGTESYRNVQGLGATRTARRFGRFDRAFVIRKVVRRTPARCRRDRGSSAPSRSGRPRCRRARCRARSSRLTQVSSSARSAQPKPTWSRPARNSVNRPPVQTAGHAGGCRTACRCRTPTPGAGIRRRCVRRAAGSAPISAAIPGPACLDVTHRDRDVVERWNCHGTSCLIGRLKPPVCLGVRGHAYPTDTAR